MPTVIDFERVEDLAAGIAGGWYDRRVELARFDDESRDWESDYREHAQDDLDFILEQSRWPFPSRTHPWTIAGRLADCLSLLGRDAWRELAEAMVGPKID